MFSVIQYTIFTQGNTVEFNINLLVDAVVFNFLLKYQPIKKRVCQSIQRNRNFYKIYRRNLQDFFLKT